MSTVMKAPVFLPRYNESQRLVHWTVALSFIVATLSGLALFHPAFWFLSGAVGGGVWSRILHPWAGVVMVAAFVPMALWYWRDNLIRPYDVAWLKRLADVMNNAPDLPEIDKYNAGQKMLFWSIIGSLALLLVTGLVLWFHPGVRFPMVLVRISGAVHVLAAMVLFLGMMVHIYSAVFWIRGSMRAMVRGVVKPGWARHHHPLWYKRVTGKQ